MRLAAWLRMFLSVLTLQPTFAQAAAASPQEVNTGAAKPRTYVVEFNWSQVRRLAPGTEIMVKKPGVTLPRRSILAVNDDVVTTFAVSDLAVEFAKQLRKAAVTHPEYWLEPQPAGVKIPLGGRVSLKDSGVFVGERKVADLQEFTVTISRAEIDSGSATVSTVPVRNRMPLTAKILIAAGIGIVALAIIVANLLPYT